ncbi:6-carboxytetrahydropterin synthase QueD [Candidatus Pacearchaeota archaeon]|nr:6-carboxytetrahydropterin synthase QueD [Candidatus Pacearchaeota archaeon]|tara:strand:- start:9761 stop:10198 length:438 start_codon:yes stop_codon:yes gene_type:complete
MIISKKIEIDMAHRLPNHEGKCKNIHGHRYVIEVGVEGEIIIGNGKSDEGMVVDFGNLKKILGETIDNPFDHSLVVYDGDELKDVYEELEKRGQRINFVPFIPTVENLAKYWFELIGSRLTENNKIKLKFVRVWETSTSTATYEN